MSTINYHLNCKNPKSGRGFEISKKKPPNFIITIRYERWGVGHRRNEERNQGGPWAPPIRSKIGKIRSKMGKIRSKMGAKSY